MPDKKIYPTPAARDHKGARSTNECLKAGRNPDTNSLGSAVCEGDVAGKLNCDWVEWLMGWPIGWTKLEPIEESNWLWLDWSADPADGDGLIPRTECGIKNHGNRLKALGNGQVPQCAAMAFMILSKGL